jgi:nucleotide-binding universal stress UspA family protein
MKTVVGVDTHGHYKPAVTLLERLAFADWQAHLLHVVEVMIDGPRPALRPNDPLLPFFTGWEGEGNDALESAASALGIAADRVRRDLRYGNPARVLIEVADAQGADLIAVGSMRKGAFGSFFFGSVSRALTVAAPQSVLIGKDEPQPHGPIAAVVATDHSEYTNRCLDTLISMRPGGLGAMTVLTAARFREGSDGRLMSDLPPRSPAGVAWSREELVERSERVCDRLRTLGCHCDARIVEAHPNEAIRQTLQETGAELLILGAQGHSFWERLRVGSVALHQAIAEPHSLLILRGVS